MAGYTRQSVADIIPGEDITSAPLNAEFDAIETAFSGTSGHVHDGSTANGPKISLSTSVSGLLPTANIADNAITTVKITNNNVTLAKLATMSNLTVIGNVSGSTATPTAVSVLDEDTMSSNSATALATQQSIKAYVDSTAFNSALPGQSVSTEGQFIKSVSLSGVWSDIDYTTDIINTPSLATVATSGNYSDLSGTPSLATVATSGDYTDLINTPSLSSQAQAEAGTDNTTIMTPLRVSQAIDVQINPFSVKTSDFNAESGAIYRCETGSAIIATLPVSPADGNMITIRRKGANNVTIARNGNTIAGIAENLILNGDKMEAILVYNGTTSDWEVGGGYYS